jgi:CubicO group peptidase (beta-lactamase class C family)
MYKGDAKLRWRDPNGIKTLIFSLTMVALPSVGQDLPTGSPEALGMSTERLARIRPMLQQYVESGTVPGIAAMVARHGKVVYFEVFGQAQVEPSVEMDRSTIFRIYSMTKPVVSVAAMMLFEEGLFRLDDPVSIYLPELEGLGVYDESHGDSITTTVQERPMTIRHLLTHTSGLANGLEGESYVDSLYRRVNILDREDSLDETLAKLARFPLLHQPGTTWKYGISMDVIAVLIERLAGKPLDEFLHERIFEPLRLLDTGYYVRTENHHRLAGCYERDSKGNWVHSRQFWADEYETPPRLHAGGFGLASTMSDYMRFLQMILNGGELEGVRLLSPKTVELMLSDNLPVGVEMYFNYGYGLGFSVLKDRIRGGRLASTGTVGGGGVANTFFGIDRQDDIIWMVWAQALPCCQWKLNSAFETLVHQAIIDK